MKRIFLLASVLLLLFGFLWVHVVEAVEDLELSFNNGRVTIIATNVQIEKILTKWTQVGGTAFIDANAMKNQPVTLTLRNVPESEALRILLRAVTGYVVAPWSEKKIGLSSFRRVLIMTAARLPISQTPSRFTDQSSVNQESLLLIEKTGDFSRSLDLESTGDNAIIEMPDNELELIQSLRDRYERSTTPVSAFSRSGIIKAGEEITESNINLQTTPRPGMIIAASE
jgi:hypothetical protein